jgi:hypothetical protein
MALWAARQRVSESSSEVRPQPLMQLAAKLNHALAELDTDLRAGGFGQDCRGLARELYASFTATIVATRGTEAEAKAWAIGHALAIDLYRSGRRRGALALLHGLIELASGQCHPTILASLTNAAEAIDQKMGRRRRVALRTDKVADGPSAAAIRPVQGPLAQDTGGEVAVSAHKSERPTPILVPPPDLLAPRRRSRRGRVIIAAAATVLVCIALYVLVTHDGNLIRQSLSTLTSAATSPSDASLANASTSNAPRATVPMAIGSPDKTTTGALTMGTAGGTATGATEKSPPQQVQSQFLSPEEIRYAKARQDQLPADATRILAASAPKTGTPLLDLKTRDGAAAVQTKLRALGYYHHTVDGIWGPMSAAALSTFRQEKGLSSGGVWDLAAQSALLEK